MAVDDLMMQFIIDFRFHSMRDAMHVQLAPSLFLFRHDDARRHRPRRPTDPRHAPRATRGPWTTHHNRDADAASGRPTDTASHPPQPQQSWRQKTAVLELPW